MFNLKQENILAFHYLKGTENAPETIELDLADKRGRPLICRINCDYLVHYGSVFPCSDGTRCWLDQAVHIDVLHFLKAERTKLLEGETIKSLKGWQESGLPNFEDYCFPGDRVAEDLVDHFINMLPPVSLSSACAQPGKEVACIEGKPTYTTFHRISDQEWIYDGNCFQGETVCQGDIKPRLDRLIEAEEAQPQSQKGASLGKAKQHRSAPTR